MTTFLQVTTVGDNSRLNDAGKHLVGRIEGTYLVNGDSSLHHYEPNFVDKFRNVLATAGERRGGLIGLIGRALGEKIEYMHAELDVDKNKRRLNAYHNFAKSLRDQNCTWAIDDHAHELRLHPYVKIMDGKFHGRATLHHFPQYDQDTLGIIDERLPKNSANNYEQGL